MEGRRLRACGLQECGGTFPPDFPPSGGYSLHSKKTRSDNQGLEGIFKKMSKGQHHLPPRLQARHFTSLSISFHHVKTEPIIRSAPQRSLRDITKWLACHYVLVTSKRNLFIPVSNLTLLGSGKKGFGF